MNTREGTRWERLLSSCPSFFVSLISPPVFLFFLLLSSTLTHLVSSMFSSEHSGLSSLTPSFLSVECETSGPDETRCSPLSMSCLSWGMISDDFDDDSDGDDDDDERLTIGAVVAPDADAKASSAPKHEECFLFCRLFMFLEVLNSLSVHEDIVFRGHN